MLIVLDRYGMRNAPLADDAWIQSTGGLRDAILFLLMNIAFNILQANVCAGSDTKADTCGGGRTFGYGAGHARASDTRDIRGRGGQERPASGQCGNAKQEQRAAGQHRRQRYGGGSVRSNHSIVMNLDRLFHSGNRRHHRPRIPTRPSTGVDLDDEIADQTVELVRIF